MTEPQPLDPAKSQARETPPPTDLTPLAIIRTETVLSRLPIHNLAKKGSINIRIIRKTPSGEVDLLWKVSPSRDHGEPRQLAYKLDTLVINRRIEEQGRPLPKLIRLGSLNQLCTELGLAESGKNKNDLRNALRQNAGAFITAKLNYKSADGGVRDLEADFTRYSLLLTGDKLPNGKKADAVHLILNDPYREVLNNAPIRPLNYDYLKELPPAAQRFYELISYKIFGALENRKPQARISYSEYSTYSAQRRYYQFWKVNRQMTPIHQRHLASGYLSDVRYQETTDASGSPDWDMFYTPGPKARAEYEAFTRKRLAALGVSQSETVVSGQRENREAPEIPAASAEQGIDPALVAEITKRGVILTDRLRESLRNLAPGQHVMDQLEYGDSVKGRQGPGFYVWLLKNNVTPPDDFPTSRKRRLWDEARQAREHKDQQRASLELAYDHYREQEIEKHISGLREGKYPELVEAKKKELAAQYKNFARYNPSQLEKLAERAVRAELAKWVALDTFEAFCEQEHQRQVQPGLPYGQEAPPQAAPSLPEQGSEPPASADPA